VETLWVWFALDAPTKIIPVLKIGPRTQPLAHAGAHPTPLRVGDYSALVKVLAPDSLPSFTSDGLRVRVYCYALTAHFGDWVTPLGQHARRWQVRVDPPSASTANSLNSTAIGDSSALNVGPGSARSRNSPPPSAPPKRHRFRTPAQAAGLTNHLWTITELLAFPLPKTVH
jgi:hypothetical protein